MIRENIKFIFWTLDLFILSQPPSSRERGAAKQG